MFKALMLILCGLVVGALIAVMAIYDIAVPWWGVVLIVFATVVLVFVGTVYFLFKDFHPMG